MPRFPVRYIDQEDKAIKEFADILMLLVIMGGIFFLTWLTTRFLSRRLPGNARTSTMRMIEKLPIGKDRQIILVKVGESHFMIGVTGQQISFSQPLEWQSANEEDTKADLS